MVCSHYERVYTVEEELQKLYLYKSEAGMSRLSNHYINLMAANKLKRQ